MLESLTINNIVLIDKLHIDLSTGLCVLTGETGSGKSILLDALGLAIGFRSNSKLLRNGKDLGVVVADFNINNNENCKNLLKEGNIIFDNNIILRRVLYKDGKSKAFINDVQVTQSFLQNIGETLVEIHGQNDQIGLLNPSFHREILDNYGNLIEKQKNVSNIYEKMKNSQNKLNELLQKKDNNKNEQDYLEHIINEIESLNIHIGEEEELTKKRTLMMNKEKILNILNEVRNNIEEEYKVEKGISSSQYVLSKNVSLGENLLEENKNVFAEMIENLDIATENINEVSEKLNSIFYNLGFDNNTLNDIEERLFAIRGLARKLNIQSDSLIEYKEDLKNQLYILKNQEIIISDLEKETKELKENYLKYAKELSNERKQIAETLSKEIMNELTSLKMEKTIFKVKIDELSENEWSKYGIDSIRFTASTNPGTPLNDLNKIASGGELSRFMLALKVVLLKTNTVPTIIFDEIDTGISGEVASAVGERLKKLSKKIQVIVVTHLAQIASKGDYHLKVQKIENNNETNTIVTILNKEERIKEIARIFSGENITNEALKVSENMLNNNEL